MDQWSAYFTFILSAGVQVPVKEKKDPSPFKNSAGHNDNENIHPLFLEINLEILTQTL